MKPRLPDNTYGLQLTFDGYGASKELCGNAALVHRMLDEMPARIGMRPLGSPHVVHVDEPGIRGLSGFRFIMESHISIHTYEERGFITVDIYSCKAFDAEKAAQLIARTFDVASYEHSVLLRGKRFGELGVLE